MAWDFAEANPFADAGGSVASAIDKGAIAIDYLPANYNSKAVQEDSATQSSIISLHANAHCPTSRAFLRLWIEQA